MKKNNLKKLALLGIFSGLIAQSLSAAEVDAAKKSANNSTDSDPNAGNVGYYLMTEEQLLLELTPERIKQYQELSTENKAIVRKIASMRCKGTNPCKGYNVCKSDHNDCAGKASCKGESECALSDKNLAVKLVYDKAMKEKREKLAEPKAK